jgi:hypothetical protein
MAPGNIRLRQLIILLVATIGATEATRASPGAPGGPPELKAVLRSAEKERLVNKWIEVSQLRLGPIRPGMNTFTARVKNMTAEAQLVGLDLRTEPGLWFWNSQEQYSLQIPPHGVRHIDVQYVWNGVGPDARLRIRFGKGIETKGSPVKLAAPDIERFYQVGNGNSYTAHPQLKTEHFDIYVRGEALAQFHLNSIAGQREEALKELEGLLGVTVRDRIGLVFFSDAGAKTKETNHTGAGLACDGMIVELYNAETRLNPFHELAHIVGGRLGDPPALFNEGFAVYVSERLGSLPLGELGHPNCTVDQAACDLSKAGELLPLDQLFDYEEIGSNQSRPRVAYAQAASVVKYLINTAGLDQFRQAYAQLRRSREPRDLALNRENFERIFGQSVSGVERGWRPALLCTAGD